VLLRFFYAGILSFIPVFTPQNLSFLHHCFAGEAYGYRVCRWRRPAVGRHGFAGVGVPEAGETCWRPLMISLDMLYGFGGLCAVLLLAYLVYALICAEEF
jgi:K+-transporting ATPase KdpF subunit